MKHYEFLLFDADDTLLDFKKNEQVSLQNLFDHISYPLTKEVLNRYYEINHSLWDSFERGEITKETVVNTRFKRLFEELGEHYDGSELETYYQNELGKGAFMMEGAYALCENLSKTHTMYMVTNGVSKTQRSRLKASGLDRFFRKVFVSEDVGYQKPSIEYFNFVFSNIPEFDPSKALIIGDSISSDILGGNNAGIDTCWFNPKGLKRPTHISITHEIKELEELYEII